MYSLLCLFKGGVFMHTFHVSSIGTVHNTRKTPEDDYWGEVVSEIRLNNDWDESSLDGIDAFSHVEIIFLFHLVSDDQVQYTARHPRNKNRPNKMGLTTVELIERNGSSIFVKGLDAIDGTPVLDIKPVMSEFLPKGKVKQPKWSTELMMNYWE